MRVLIVCTGNTCRSPMLMFMLRRHLSAVGVRNVEVDSAGTMDHFKPMSPYTDDVLTRHGITHVKSISKFCDAQLFGKADLIFTMTAQHAEQLCAAYGKSKKVVPLSRIMGQDVPDPYGLGQAAYDEVYDAFEGALKKLTAYIKRVKKRLETNPA